MENLDYWDRIELFETLYPNPDEDKTGKNLAVHTSELKYNPLYGEIRRLGIHTLFDFLSKDNKNELPSSFTDLGCGIGKIPVLAFLFYPFERINGVELCLKRFQLAKQVLLDLHHRLVSGWNLSLSSESTENSLSITLHSNVSKVSNEPNVASSSSTIKTKTLTLYYGNIYDFGKKLRSSLYLADFAFEYQQDGQRLLDFMKEQEEGTQFILYEPLQSFVGKEDLSPYFYDIYLPTIETSWGMHSFYGLRKSLSPHLQTFAPEEKTRHLSQVQPRIKKYNSHFKTEQYSKSSSYRHYVVKKKEFRNPYSRAPQSGNKQHHYDSKKRKHSSLKQ